MKRLVGIIVLLVSLTAGAQQVPDLYHYYRYPALINPASVGLAEKTEVLALYKNQWVGMPDGPQTQMLMVNTPLKKDKLGLGFTLYNDLVHIFGNTGAFGSLSYRLNLASDHQLYFGLSGGAYNSRIFFDKIRAEDPFESTLLVNSESVVKPDANAGIRYQWNKFHAGFSSNHIFQNNFRFENAKDQKSLAYRLVRHYYISAGYKYSLNEQFDLEPMLLIRSAQGLPSQLEVNSTILYKSKIWINLAYRHQASAGASLGFLIDEKLTLGYHFEYPLTEVRKVSTSSHEFALSYKFGSSAHAPAHIEGLDKLHKDNEEQYEMIDQLEKKTDTLKQRIDQHDMEIDQLREIFEKEKQEDERLKKQEEVPLNELNKKGKDDVAHTYQDFYLVVGSFSTVQNAKLYQEVLMRDYNLKTKMALSRPIDGKSRFLVYTQITHNSEEAKKEIKKLKDLDKNSLFNQDPWLYRVK